VKTTILNKLNFVIKLNWVHLSLNFGKLVPSATTQGWFAQLHPNYGICYLLTIQNRGKGSKLQPT
jgi:hypothetical protein